MAKSKLDDIKTTIQKAIDSFDRRGVIGPIGYLEEAMENIEAAIEEEEQYSGGEESDEQRNNY